MDLYVLEVSFSFGEKEDTLYPVVLRHGPEVILVDCGYAGFAPLLQGAMEKHGLSFTDLTGVIITHHDMDHMGALAELKEQYPSLQVYSSPAEKPYIDGTKKSLRLQQAEDLYPCLPEEEKPGAEAFRQALASVRTVAVDGVLTPGEELPFMPGVRVVATPGHMPGHISLYLPGTKTLVEADAVVYGAFDIANPHYTLDLPAALASIEKLQQLAIDTIVCFHGGLVREGVSEGLCQLLARYQKNEPALAR
jgi:glyoxylase-like metal-dependent hydrolase (beta-lactamase superfamily II)